MGTRRKPRSPAVVSLSDGLFSQTKQRVLGLLFGQPERSFGTVELITLARSGRGAVQRELETLTASRLITTSAVGLQKRYQANHDAPIFDELRSIVRKTGGIPAALRAALAPLHDRLEVAILYGSVAKHTDTAASDIDVLIVTDVLALEDIFKHLDPAEQQLGRRINPTLYTPAEFRSRLKAKHPFLTKVLAGPHEVLVGEIDGATAAR